MIKKAFAMKIYPDKHEEYRKRHDELWPEMRAMLKEHGASQYSIFLDPETSELFGYLEIEDEERWSETAATAINRNGGTTWPTSWRPILTIRLYQKN